MRPRESPESFLVYRRRIVASDELEVPVAERPATRGLANKMMRVLLRTPGLDRLLGKSVALIAFEGTKTGKVYEIPVSYARVDDTVAVLSRASRVWWRNLRSGPVVRLRLAGKDYSGRATVSVGGEAELDSVVGFLKGRRFDANAYGVSLGPDGNPSETDVRRLLPGIVVIRIELTAPSRRPDEDTISRRNGP